jgi:hypothetical protein
VPAVEPTEPIDPTKQRLYDKYKLEVTPLITKNKPIRYKMRFVEPLVAAGNVTKNIRLEQFRVDRFNNQSHISGHYMLEVGKPVPNYIMRELDEEEKGVFNDTFNYK